ncbi:MAG: hypothetical protein LUI13_10030 [Lachnospiraceae bacterium]|nr:hypothetical protein [Lachnospiraceae bacterium]
MTKTLRVSLALANKLSLIGLLACFSIRDSFNNRVEQKQVMFQTVENIILLAEKDDLQSYLRFLEDAFAYMVNYHYEEGMNLALQEMQSLLRQPDVGAIEDRALLCEFKELCYDRN